ncbi:MAG: DUF4347 domain-containing protein, partial [Pirellulaceae bacterium]
MLSRILSELDRYLITANLRKEVDPNAPNQKINATVLEDRILYSATPLGDPSMLDPSLLDADALDPNHMDLDDLPTAASGQSGDDGAFQDQEDTVPGEELDTDQEQREIFFIDESVDNFDELVDDLLAINDPNRTVEIVILTSDRDGIDQITDVLGGMHDVDAIHIVSHGSAGQVQLGNSVLSNESIAGYAGQLAQWASALDSGADLLFYGCDLASGDGETLVESIAELTSADVAASDDLTGHEELGGDWILEFQVGDVTTDVAFSYGVQSSWDHTLATITVTTTDDENDGDTSSISALLASSGGTGISLREAIIAANNTAGADTITLGSGVYVLDITGQFEEASATGDLDVLSEIVINGDGAGVTTIDATGLSDRLFDVHAAGNLSLNGLTITGASTTTEYGAGVQNVGTFSATDLVISNMTVSNADGAGIYSTGTTTLERVSIIGSSAVNGGAISVAGGVTTLTNVTVSGNQSQFDGAGIHVSSGTVDVVHSTIANNDSTSGNGGGLFRSGGTVNVNNSIVADNSSVFGGNDVHGTIVSGGYNIIEDNSNFTGSAGTDILGVDPGLNGLQLIDGNYVHTFTTSSNAYNAANTVGAPTTDQLGTARDANPDIGAFEYDPLTDWIGVDTTSDLIDGTTTNVATLLANRGADGLISLREAIIAINNDSGTNWTISLAAGTYNFASGTGDTAGDFDIRNNMTLVG